MAMFWEFFTFELKFHEFRFAKSFDPFPLSLDPGSSAIEAIDVDFIKFPIIFNISSDCHFLSTFLLEKGLAIAESES